MAYRRIKSFDFTTGFINDIIYTKINVRLRFVYNKIIHEAQTCNNNYFLYQGIN